MAKEKAGRSKRAMPAFPKTITALAWVVTANHAGCSRDGDGFPHYRVFPVAFVEAGINPGAEEPVRLEAERWARDTYGAAGMKTRVELVTLAGAIKFPKG